MKHARSLNATEILELIFIYLTEVSASREHDDIIRILADMGKALTSSDRCTVWIVNEDSKTIWTKVAHGIDRLELPMDSGIVGHCITTGEKAIIDDVYEDDRFNREIDKKTGYNTKNMMVIPMFDSDDNIIGAFQVMNHRGKVGLFDTRDMQRLMLASTYAAESVISSMLAQEVEDTQREVVFTMGAIAESRSKETGNHVKRVSEYSKLLALAYGMSEEDAELLRQASPMHDIGKVAIPDAILKKPGRFTASEFEIMKRHAELGYHMIKNSDRPLFQTAAIVAYEHHEKWNGTGYPRGLTGEDIHIYGRITAVADVFDALGSDRVYKKAWNDKNIFKLFKEEKGKQFDPDLVDLFFDNLDDILSIREEFKDTFKEDTFKEKESINNIKILGAHGTKAKNCGSSAFFLNDTNVIDAGNLLVPLEEKSANLENIWLTHSHLDHISDIAFILDNYFPMRNKTLKIMALPQTINAIKKHFFNDLIWPDFSKVNIINSDKKAIEYVEIELDKTYDISSEESIQAFKTYHSVPSCGYIYKKKENAVAITADTHSLKRLIEIVDNDKEIKSIVVECSFPSDMSELAKESKHLTPELLFKELQNLQRDDIELYINHIKPSYLEIITREIDENKGKWNPIILKDLDIIHF